MNVLYYDSLVEPDLTQYSPVKKVQQNEVTRQPEPDKTLPIEQYGEEHHLEEALQFLDMEKVEIKSESKRGKGTEEFQEWSDLNLDLHLDVDEPNSSTDAKSKELLETHIGQ